MEVALGRALNGVQIFVGVKRAVFGFDYRNGDIRAMVGNALVVGEQIVKHEAELYRAVALLQAVDVIILYMGDYSVGLGFEEWWTVAY